MDSSFTLLFKLLSSLGREVYHKLSSRKEPVTDSV